MDTRGYAYVTTRLGIWIVRYTAATSNNNATRVELSSQPKPLCRLSLSRGVGDGLVPLFDGV